MKFDFIILLMGLKCFLNMVIFKDYVFVKRLFKKENCLYEWLKNVYIWIKFKDSFCYRFI